MHDRQAVVTFAVPNERKVSWYGRFEWPPGLAAAKMWDAGDAIRQESMARSQQNQWATASALQSGAVCNNASRRTRHKKAEWNDSKTEIEANTIKERYEY